VQWHTSVGRLSFRFVLVAFNVTPLDEDFTQQPVEVGPLETEDFASPQPDTSSQQNHHSIHPDESCQQQTEFIPPEHDARL
jgi:hypothetical protein